MAEPTQLSVETDNNAALRQLIEASGLTQEEARELCNAGQARPLASSTWKAYLAPTSSARRRECPDTFLAHTQRVLGRFLG